MPRAIRFWLSILLPVLAVNLGVSQKVDYSAHVQGTWKYDLLSIRLEFTPEATKELQKLGTGSKAKVELMKQQLSDQIAPMRMTFGPKGAFSVGTQGNPNGPRGKWTIHGQKIDIVLDNKAQAVPQITYLPKKNRIQTTYKNGKMGTGYVEMERVQ